MYEKTENNLFCGAVVLCGVALGLNYAYRNNTKFKKVVDSKIKIIKEKIKKWEEDQHVQITVLIKDLI